MQQHSRYYIAISLSRGDPPRKSQRAIPAQLPSSGTPAFARLVDSIGPAEHFESFQGHAQSLLVMGAGPRLGAGMYGRPKYRVTGTRGP
jgi:hypothetical protein